VTESYRDLYKVGIEDARNRLVLEVQRLQLEQDKQIQAAHERCANVAKENAELRIAIGCLQERFDKMAEWAKKQGKEKT